jgi:hypothetical protein
MPWMQPIMMLSCPLASLQPTTALYFFFARTGKKSITDHVQCGHPERMDGMEGFWKIKGSACK